MIQIAKLIKEISFPIKFQTTPPTEMFNSADTFCENEMPSNKCFLLNQETMKSVERILHLLKYKTKIAYFLNKAVLARREENSNCLAYKLINTKYELPFGGKK